MLNIVNLITASCALVMVWAAIQLFALTRSNGVFVLVAATTYLMFIRLSVTIAEATSGECWITEHTSYLIAPFWPLMAAGFLILLHSMRAMMREPMNDRRQTPR